ncbi:MAG: hypothetical protein N2645_07345 [Clostridia bacterium]|nr:hypothetical protein [Clostridia bacterium]
MSDDTNIPPFSILSKLLTYREANGEDADILKRIFPVAWRHINLYGRYEFNKNPEVINMDEIIEELSRCCLPDLLAFLECLKQSLKSDCKQTVQEKGRHLYFKKSVCEDLRGLQRDFLGVLYKKNQN